MRIAALSPAAAALGLSAGMALADARAQVPDIEVLPHDPGADAEWLARLADFCDRYSPSVAIDPPDALVLDVTGCLHPYGDEAGMIADMERRLAGLHLRIAAGATPEAALALARYGMAQRSDEGQAIRALPVAALRLDGEVATALRRAGLAAIGDLADRPTAPLAARFGAVAVDALDRLLGRADSRLTPRRLPPALQVERRFAEPIAHVDTALAVLEELIGEAAVDLEERGKGGRRFAARLFRSDGALADLAVETSRPTRTAATVMRLFRERIAALADPLDPGFGFDMIRLIVPRIEPLTPAQLQLEGGTVSEEAMAALIDRLSSRLGRGAIRRFQPRDTHVPEQAALTLPAVDLPAPEPWEAPQPGEPPTRPIHLFDPPQPIEVIAEVPDGPPHRFRWKRQQHHVVRFEGPERIAAPWWKHAPGRSGLTRDYYRIEDARGRRFWIFRHGLYDSERPDPRWYVHGLFA